MSFMKRNSLWQNVAGVQPRARVVICGDDLATTAGLSTKEAGWMQQACYAWDAELFLCSAAGLSVANVGAAIAELSQLPDPDAVIVVAGTTSFAAGESAVDMLADLDAALLSVRTQWPNSPIGVGTVTPDTDATVGEEAERVAFNAGIRTRATLLPFKTLDFAANANLSAVTPTYYSGPKDWNAAGHRVAAGVAVPIFAVRNG